MNLPTISPVLIEFLDSTSGRDKLYRTIQYAARLVRWSASEQIFKHVVELLDLTSDESGNVNSNGNSNSNQKVNGGNEPSSSMTSGTIATAHPTTTQRQLSSSSSNSNSINSNTSAVSRRRTSSTENGAVSAPTLTSLDIATHANWSDKLEQLRLDVITAAKSVELSFSNGRKLFRLLKFLNMYQVFITYKDKKRSTFILKQIRTAIYAIYFLADNISWADSSKLIYLTSKNKARVLDISAWTWLITTLLSFVIDFVTGQGTKDSFTRHIADLPMAFTLVFKIKLNDGLIGLLGLISSLAGCRMEIKKARAVVKHHRH